MISTEIQSDTCNAKNSATDALLWLKRYEYYLLWSLYKFKFTLEFTISCNEGPKNSKSLLSFYHLLSNFALHLPTQYTIFIKLFSNSQYSRKS